MAKLITPEEKMLVRRQGRQPCNSRVSFSLALPFLSAVLVMMAASPVADAVIARDDHYVIKSKQHLRAHHQRRLDPAGEGFPNNDNR
eukprot:CAMPEP_0183738200 /NCGR_PEP_ID=MMETSP0737-20130205/54010_1 /TAXON_ID=385413 /ORGANISM="Thalassiosira miniscula, Strain CCMP1093" /LENGTH=86 /DNA_ID=CAMNT_0025972685 /DNA_START=100 /DNA_END=357 /DNA_ORIENTATION=+